MPHQHLRVVENLSLFWHDVPVKGKPLRFSEKDLHTLMVARWDTDPGVQPDARTVRAQIALLAHDATPLRHILLELEHEFGKTFHRRTVTRILAEFRRLGIRALRGAGRPHEDNKAQLSRLYQLHRTAPLRKLYRRLPGANRQGAFNISFAAQRLGLTRPAVRRLLKDDSVTKRLANILTKRARATS